MEPRFAFGRNWQRYLRLVDDERIASAEMSLTEMLEVRDLEGQSFLDIGCGSGLFSLAACRLGAQVVSFDIDPDSVACAMELRERHEISADTWRIETGSILDDTLVSRLPHFDIVYSWGVLHHTGQMWSAIENARSLVAERGALYIAIYNDQGGLSKVWTRIKRTYVAGVLGRAAVLATFVPLFAAKSVLRPRRSLERGMSQVIDWVDWLGGYPFEVATPDAVVESVCRSGFVLTRIRTVGIGHGCNEFVFRRL